MEEIMKIFNTLTRRKDEFVPIEEGKVRMYVCGPTVYNYIHIGNARPMIVFDTVRRYFEYKGYDVNYVSNFTDVDDKIIKKANEEGVDASVISERFIKEAQKDMADMNVKEATHHPKATEEIDGMIDMIQTLINKGHAYAVDGTVYSKPVPSRITASFPRRTLMILKPATEKSRLTVKKARKIRWISFSGSEERRRTVLAFTMGRRPSGLAY